MAYQISYRRAYLHVSNPTIDFHNNATGSKLTEPSHSCKAFLFMSKSSQSRPETVYGYLASLHPHVSG